jgi:hypothetical protein
VAQVETQRSRLVGAWLCANGTKQQILKTLNKNSAADLFIYNLLRQYEFLQRYAGSAEGEFQRTWDHFFCMINASMRINNHRISNRFSHAR